MPANMSGRVISRLVQAEACEYDPHFRDDLRIARLAVHYAATGEASICGPHVLASYMVLGLHPQKVWPKILARRNALGFEEVSGAAPVPKKPPQSVKLWAEKTNAARALNSCGALQVDSQRLTISVPMAAPSIAALYPNSDDPSSAKKRPYSLDEMKVIVARSYASDWLRIVTLAALEARGEWPNQQGPASALLSVALVGIQIESGNAPRRTTQYRIKRACELGYWRKLRDDNSWTNCPKCSETRKVGKCGKCGYQGRVRDANGKYTGEFSRPAVYEFDLEKFRHAPPRCRSLHFRSYPEFKESRNKVREMPRREPESAPPPKSPAPARREEPQRKTAEHQRTQHVVTTQITTESTKAAELVFEMCGLADISLIAKIAIGVATEAKWQGIEIQAAAKYIAECAIRDQKNGITLNGFYWRDLKWRTNGVGRQAASASAERSERSKRNILAGILANARGADAPDGPEREE